MRGLFVRARGAPAGSLAIMMSLPFMLAAPIYSRSPAQLLARALAASRAQSSVRWSSHGSFDGETETLTTNAGTNEGSQVVSLVKGRSHGEVSAKLIADTVYVNGDIFALRNYMGFTATAATDEANRWLSIPHSNPDFSAVAAGLTIGSTTTELEMTRPIASLGESIVLGQKVVGLKGKARSPAGKPQLTMVVYVRARGVQLPVEAKLTYQSVTDVISLGHWNERVAETTPSDAISLQTSWLR